ncbi:hypothetical protein [Nocardiopsis sp. CA-288880]|uniref:hypothetical protein n=1 Tax=Nocardiopsis sp. CA-288880 TaxID=3239995 RepID=UPI003D9723CC
MLKVHQMRHEAHFTILANQAIRDGRLSGLARSVLMELISRPKGWQTNADQMWRQARKDRGERAEGRRAFRAAFSELEEFGYLIRELKHNGKRVETVMHLFHLPQEGSGKGSGNGSGDDAADQGNDKGDPEADQEDSWGTGSGTSDSGTSGSGTSETGTSLRRTDNGSTDVGSTEEEESFRARSARSGSIASDQARDEQAAKQQREERQRQRAAELNRRWDLVDALSPDDLRAAMLKLEQQRPTIYRKARQDALGQLKGDGISSTPKGVDNLACKFALLHYANKGIMTPAFLAKPLGLKDTA